MQQFYTEMVFGLTKKERKVPDLSRYDYYYQNQQDYNKSHHLSAAAASAAATINTRPNTTTYHSNNRNSMPRSRSMVYQSNNTINKNENVNPNSSPRKKIVSYVHSNSNVNNNYKTYSLRSQNSLNNFNNKPKRLSSTINRKINNNSTIKQTRNKRLSHSTRNNIQNNTPSNNINRLNSLNSNNTNNTNNHRLNSITSNNSRNLRRIGTNNTTSNNNFPNSNPMSRTNSITTKVTKVTDLQNRTTSITKKTIKRMDGLEIIETTTTTTNIVPINNNNDFDIDSNGNNLLTNEQHFEQFSENFISNNNHLMDDELNNLNSNNNNNNNILLDQENDLETINSNELLELQQTMQKHSSLNDNNINNINNLNVNDLLKEEQYEYDMEPDFIPNDDDIIAEEEEEDEEKTNYNINEHNINDFQKPVNPTFLSNNTVPLDQTSSMSRFTDALESVNQSNDNLVEKKIVRPAKNVNTTSSNKYKANIQPKRNIINQQAHSTQPKKKPVKKTVKLNTLPQSSPNQIQNQYQNQAPKVKKKPLTDQEMYLKALEVAKRKVYSDSNGNNFEVDPKLTDNNRSQMVSRMTLRNSNLQAPAYNSNSHNNKNNRTSLLSSVIRRSNDFENNYSRDYDSTDDENNIITIKPNTKKKLSSLFKINKNKHKKLSNDDSFENDSSANLTPVLNQSNKFDQFSNVSESPSVIKNSKNSITSNPTVDKDMSSIENSKKVRLSDEEMYNKALKISQKRLADSHKLTIQQKESEKLKRLEKQKQLDEKRQKLLENQEQQQNEIKNLEGPKKMEMDMDMHTSLNNNIDDYTFTLPLVSKERNKVNKVDSNINSHRDQNNESNDGNLGNLEAFDNLEIGNNTSNDIESDTIVNISKNNETISDNKSIVKKDVDDSKFNKSKSNEPKTDEFKTTTSNPIEPRNPPSQSAIISNSENASNIPETSHIENASDRQLNSPSNELSVAEPEVPFNEDLVTRMPTSDELNDTNKKHRRFSRRQSRSNSNSFFDSSSHHTMETAVKSKSKFKNIFNKVAKFSQENSGYQPTKKEQIEIDKQNEYLDQIERERQLSVSEQKLNPPPLKKISTLTSPHGATTTLPVEQPLDHFPNGIHPTLSHSSFQRQGSTTLDPNNFNTNVPTDNINNKNYNTNATKAKDNSKSTTTSSIFSKNREDKRNITSNVPDAEQLDIPSDIDVQNDVQNDVTLKDIQQAKLHNAVKVPTNDKKPKNNFFNKLFKRSKQSN